MVRKNAVLALEAAVCFGFVPATKETLSVFEERCRDPLLSIRKSAIQSLTNILSVRISQDTEALLQALRNKCSYGH